MLTNHDIQSMTDGQREILYLGMQMREEQIIKLLEDSEELRGHIYFWQEFGENDTEGRDRKALAIALIKGEK